MQIAEGTLLSGVHGSYTIRGKIAEGGMGFVYEGKATSGQAVVIKIPRVEGKDPVKDKMHLEKLEVETATLRKLAPEGKKHIVRYLDDGTHEEVPFLVLEKLGGANIKDRCVGRPLYPDVATHYSRILLETLSYLHSKNILHRDVNPKNLILDRERDIVLIDFGASKDGFNQISRSDAMTLIGTPSYSAPEQFFENELQTPASDLYSAGAVMYFMLTGQEPEMDYRKGRLAREPRDINRSIDARISEIVLRAVKLDAAKRFQSARSMLKALKGEPYAMAKSPFIALADSEYEIHDSLSIGRTHTCDKECAEKGHTPLDVSINDPSKYVSKHHVRINRDGNDFFLEDLGSLNYTAIFREGWHIVDRGSKVMLQDRDSVALAYDSDKDLPYITFRFIRWQ